ncbi:hypothetical protein AAFF_G00291650 [Aldrovandia affinis]|uniref:Uncharacterized protein n=1 Tax=Aldrovandia affinis TaxID=143900 RepID=A0AAD7WSM9_9TELE|nr:hypothetical protein AAFF_G00291650 [Aldrovandia affinis]
MRKDRGAGYLMLNFYNLMLPGSSALSVATPKSEEEESRGRRGARYSTTFVKTLRQLSTTVPLSAKGGGIHTLRTSKLKDTYRS